MDEPLKVEIESLADEATLKEALQNGKEALSRDSLGPLSHLSWDLVRSTLARELSEQLATGLMSWLANGWSVARQLHALKNEEGKDGKPALFKLGKHEMKGTLHPEVTISCGGTSFPPVRFDVPIKAVINATSLAVKGGHIIGLGGGECAIAMRIEYDGNDLTGDLPLKKIKLPTEYSFRKPGIPIP